MHPKTKAKTKEITKMVLDLAANGLLTWYALGSPKAIGRHEEVLGYFPDYAVKRVRETMKRLRLQDLIQYDEEDAKSPIILTEKGMRRLLRYKLKDFLKGRKKWDYFWRLIFFDIPEGKRYLRDHLRRELTNAGFYPFQKSVFVCPFDCEEMIRDFCKMYSISHHVLFCITPSLGAKEGEVRAFFFKRGK